MNKKSFFWTSTFDLYQKIIYLFLQKVYKHAVIIDKKFKHIQTK